MSKIITQQTETATKGRGYITVTGSVYPYLGSPDTFEQWHKALLLPEDYLIEEIAQSNGFFTGELYTLTVSSPAIPVLDHIEKVVITPYYGRDEQGVKLLRIEQSHWNGETWEEVK